jgi:hypothetical protein
VHETVLCAERPLTFEEIFARQCTASINNLQPAGDGSGCAVAGPQLVNLGDGRYGFLPRLIEGSLIRLPLTEKKPANHPLIYPDEARHALFPSRLDIQKRQSERPARLRLPDGSEIELALEFLGTATWGSTMPLGLRGYLVEQRAAAGDSLLIRVVEGEAGSCEAWFESRAQRDAQAMAGRDRELADAAEKVLRSSRSTDVHISNLIVACSYGVCTTRTARPTRSRASLARTHVLWLPDSMRGCWRKT